MAPMSVVHLDKSFAGVKIISGYSPQGNEGLDASSQAPPVGQVDMAAAASTQELETQKRLYHDACLALQEVASKLNQLHEEVFAEHHEAIARLSVEIARKVLMQNVNENDYKIEAIIKELLKNAPENSGLVVRLNPQDLADLEKLQDDGQAAFPGVKFTTDASVGKAECVAESPKGIVKLLIDEHLEQIGNALTKAG